LRRSVGAASAIRSRKSILSNPVRVVTTVAYLANQFPAAVEPYVGAEIQELRERGVHVLASSVRRSRSDPNAAAGDDSDAQVLYLQPVRLPILVRALGLLLWRWKRVSVLLARVLLQGKESPKLRAKALLHTYLGAYYAVLLGKYRVDHIHVHHGYFGSWIAMAAARLLDVGFSLTLHGSDLLLDGAYLDVKLENCQFCVTISDYNRRYILQRFPAIDSGKILVSRLGVDVPTHAEFPRARVVRAAHRTFSLLAVGRLHPVKDHAFLVRACAQLRDYGLDFECAIAGEGPERQRLECLIHRAHLQDHFRLLGHVAREHMDALYEHADLVVLSSRSEGIPLVLMEAMARGKIVLAPAITGIPELVIPGKTGFLYAPGALKDFLARILFLHERIRGEDPNAVLRLDWLRHAARVQVLHNFSRRKNLTRFCNQFLQLTAAQDWSLPHEDFVLQQI
jgi:glycosyltransferase involved in cell wall biosynthesis